MTNMIDTWINDRWPLLLPEHRHLRPEWPWWEAGRLASMWHALAAPYIFDGDLGHGVPREVVYDIGAEEGDFPALWSSWGCDVVLFEPNDRVWPNIKAIWTENRLRAPLACWSGFVGPKETAPLPTWLGWPQSADGEVIGDHGFLNLAERPDVPVTTIDAMAEAVEPPTAITIDIEGAELLALKGAVETLRTHRPKVWVSVHDEFALDMYGVKPGEVVDFMESFGYLSTFIAQDHEAHWMFLPR